MCDHAGTLAQSATRGSRRECEHDRAERRAARRPRLAALRRWLGALGVSAALAITARADPAAPHDRPAVRNVVQMKFGGLRGLPSCASVAVQNGDPSNGPFVALGKFATGCALPWHWHTANAQLILVSGVVRLERKDARPFTLRAGGYASLPAHRAHQVRCERACLAYLIADGAFDIHYLGPQDAEIPPNEALKAVGEIESRTTP
jgi:quercetin dioxygenase-like cupin family protein